MGNFEEEPPKFAALLFPLLFDLWNQAAGRLVADLDELLGRIEVERAEPIHVWVHEHISFAKQLAARLDSARIDGSFSRLVLAAPPAFLGLLRDNMSKEVMEMVYSQIDKNLVQQSPEALRVYM